MGRIYKGIPKKVFVEATVPADADYTYVPLNVVPVNETWSLCKIEGSMPTGVIGSDLSVYGDPVGLYVEGGSFGSFSPIEAYGRPLDIAHNAFGIMFTNTTGAEVKATFSLYVIARQIEVE